MDPTNLLGMLSGMGGNGIPQGVPQAPDVAQPSFPDLNASLAANALKPAPPAQESHGLFHQGGTISNILGALGDAFLVQSGHEPVYANMMRQKKIGAALRNYLGNIEPGLASIMQTDPSVGLELYKIKHPASETPAGLKEFEYYQKLPPDQRGSYEQFLKLTHPGLISPISLGPNDTYDAGTGGGSGGPPPDAVNYLKAHPELAPHFDEKYGAGAAARAMGGATASTPSSTFPAR